MTLNLTLDDLELGYIFTVLIKVYNVRVNDLGIIISLCTIKLMFYLR